MGELKTARHGQYRCAFHAPNQPHSHSMEEVGWRNP